MNPFDLNAPREVGHLLIGSGGQGGDSSGARANDGIEYVTTLRMGPDGHFDSGANDIMRMTSRDLGEPGILGTATTASGDACPGETLTDSHRVTDPKSGYSMTVLQAVQNGLLVRDGHGGYRDPRAGQSAAPRLQNPFPLSLPGAQARGQFFDLATGAEEIEMVEAFAAKGAAGVAALSDAGPKGAAARGMAAALQEQADQAIRAKGADPAHFYAWAKANRSGDFKEAVRRHLYSANPTPYAALARDYIREVPPNIETLQAAGYRVWQGTYDLSGRLDWMVDVGGQTARVKDAARAGLFDEI